MSKNSTTKTPKTGFESDPSFLAFLNQQGDTSNVQENVADNAKLLTFLLCMFMGIKDDEQLQTKQVVDQLADDLGTDENFFNQLISSLTNNEIEPQQAALRAYEKVTPTSRISDAEIGRATQTLIQNSSSDNTLINLIADLESDGDYNRIYGAGYQTAPLTTMTVNEVRAMQEQMLADGSPSTAVGRYQVMGFKLEELMTSMNLTGNELFCEELQDRICNKLLNDRGYNKFLAGDMDEETFMKNLSKEWAALPKDANGSSYYDKDGLNKALTTPATLLAAMRLTKDEVVNTPAQDSKAQLASTFSDQSDISDMIAANQDSTTDGLAPVDLIVASQQQDYTATTSLTAKV